MKPIYHLLFFSVFLVGCQFFGSRGGDIFTIPPNEIAIVDKRSTSVTFTVVNTCASGCLINIGEKVKRVDNTFKISIVAESSGQTCPAVCLELERDITVEIPEPGAYYFQFIHRDSVHRNLVLSFP